MHNRSSEEQGDRPDTRTGIHLHDSAAFVTPLLPLRSHKCLVSICTCLHLHKRCVRAYIYMRIVHVCVKMYVQDSHENTYNIHKYTCITYMDTHANEKSKLWLQHSDLATRVCTPCIHTQTCNLQIRLSFTAKLRLAAADGFNIVTMTMAVNIA